MKKDSLSTDLESSTSCNDSSLSFKSDYDDIQFESLIEYFETETSDYSKEEIKFLKDKLDSNLSGSYLKKILVFLKEKRVMWNKTDKLKSQNVIFGLIKFKMFKPNSNKIFIIFRNPEKAKKIANYLRKSFTEKPETVYFGNPSAIILNDKKALLKNYKVYLLGYSRFSALLTQKAIDFKEMESLVFVDFEGDNNFIGSNLDLVVKANQALPEKSELILICRNNQHRIQKCLQESISMLSVEVD